MLLSTESKAEFAKLLNDLCEVIQPQGELERRYLEDIGHLTWEILRYRRAKAGIINTAMYEALQGMANELLEKSHFPDVLVRRLMADRLARGWFNDGEAKIEVVKLLGKFGLDETAIEAEAARLRADDLEWLDRMQASAEVRRKKALRFLPELRANFAERLKRSTDRLLEDADAPALVPVSKSRA